MDRAKLKSLCYNIPKAELHLHIEGTFEPELMFKLAKRNNIELPYKSVQELKEKYKFHNLQEFLDIYYQGCSTLIKKEDFSDLAYDYCCHACTQGCKYAEIFFDPQSHLPRGVSFETIIEGLKDGLERGNKAFGFEYKLIMCYLRHLPEEEALKTLETALPYKKDILAVGLDSSEVGFPPHLFKNVYEKSAKEGLLLVAHAGEEGGPDYIKEALDILKVKRIDHGVKIVQDEELLKRVAKEKIPLTMCPLSNKELKATPDLTKYPIRELMQKGVLTMINSDDPSYFGGYIGDNYWSMVESINFTYEEIVQSAKNSFEATFLSEEKKKEYIAQVEEYAKKFVA